MSVIIPQTKKLEKVCAKYAFLWNSFLPWGVGIWKDRWDEYISIEQDQYSRVVEKSVWRGGDESSSVYANAQRVFGEATA
jgi:hypothetical protein